MLPADELAQIRVDLETTLPDTCNILTLSRTSDSQGGWSETWGTATLAVECRVDFTSSNRFVGGKEKVMANALLPFSSAIITFPQDTTITEQNRIEHNSITYSVQSVNLGSWLGVKRASVEKI